MIKKELDGLANVEYINIMDDFDKAIEYGIRKAPTIVIEREGTEIGRFSGFKSKQEIEAYIESI